MSGLGLGLADFGLGLAKFFWPRPRPWPRTLLASLTSLLSGPTVLTVLLWDWDRSGIRSFETGICCSDLGLGFRFWSWDLGFQFQRFEMLEWDWDLRFACQWKCCMMQQIPRTWPKSNERQVVTSPVCHWLLQLRTISRRNRLIERLKDRTNQLTKLDAIRLRQRNASSQDQQHRYNAFDRWKSLCTILDFR